MKTASIEALYASEFNRTTNYIVKKGEPSGDNARFNDLPPGQDLFEQVNSDLSGTGSMKFKELVDSRGYN